MAKTESPSERARRLGPPTLDRLKKKQPRGREVRVHLDDDLAEKVDTLHREHAALRERMADVRGRGGLDPALEAELEEKAAELERARAALREETVVLRMRSIGRKRYDALVAEHPPSDKQKAEAKTEKQPKPEFDFDTFPVALVALSCEAPDLTAGAYEDEKTGRTRYPEAEYLFETWNDGELGSLFAAAYQVNTARRVVDLGEG